MPRFQNLQLKPWDIGKIMKAYTFKFAMPLPYKNTDITFELKILISV